jgi:hypothetical protein
MNARTNSVGIDLSSCFAKAGIFYNKEFRKIELTEEDIRSDLNEVFEILKLKIEKFHDKVGLSSSCKQIQLNFFPQNQDFKIKTNPEEIFTSIFKNAKEKAEKLLSSQVKNVVISVPVFLSYSQRKAIYDTAKLAGYDEILILNSTTAAAISYGHGIKTPSKKSYLIYNLGGKTLNLTLFNIENGSIDVLCSSSHPGLGGQMIDRFIFEHILKKIENSSGQRIFPNMDFSHLLLGECEKAKIRLTDHLESCHEIILNDTKYPFKLTRKEFEEVGDSFFNKTIQPINSLIENIGLSKTKIEEVILVGRNTFIPKIQSLLSEYFYGNQLNEHVGEAVLFGTCLQGAILSRTETNSILKYSDTANIKYSLKILTLNEEILEICIKPLDKLPSENNVIIKEHLLKQELRFDLTENEIKIFSVELKTSEYVQTEVHLSIDLNGFVRIKIKSLRKNGQFDFHELMEENKNKLGSPAHLVSKNDNDPSERKFQLEAKCSDLKIKLASKRKNSLVYLELGKSIDELADSIKSSKLNDLSNEEFRLNLKTIQTNFIDVIQDIWCEISEKFSYLTQPSNFNLENVKDLNNNRDFAKMKDQINEKLNCIEIEYRNLVVSIEDMQKFGYIYRYLKNELNDLERKKDLENSINMNQIINSMKLLKLDLEFIKKCLKHDENSLKQIKHLVDSWYSHYKITDLEFTSDIFKLCVDRENLKISKMDFYDKLNECFLKNEKNEKMRSNFKYMHDTLVNQCMHLILD